MVGRHSRNTVQKLLNVDGMRMWEKDLHADSKVCSKILQKGINRCMRDGCDPRPRNR